MECQRCHATITDATHRMNGGYCMICRPKPCLLCGEITNNRNFCDRCEAAEREKVAAGKKQTAKIREKARQAVTEAAFNDDIFSWIDNSLAKPPERINAYCFNLTDNAGEFELALVGTRTFNKGDPDWASDAIFEPELAYVILPLGKAGDSWGTCLQIVKDLLLEYLSSGRRGAMELRSKQAVGLGFVDGDLLLLHEK